MGGIWEFLATIVTWLRTSRPDDRPFEQDTGGSYVFCQLCRDWHPPGNCAGQWPGSD